MISLSLLALLYVGSWSLPLAEQVDSPPVAEETPAPTEALVLVDAPIDPYLGELLDLAARTAAAYPSQPHVKTRSKEQAAVVEACLELDQAGRALAITETIDNWRRGECYGRLAVHRAREGAPAGEVHRLVQGANRVLAEIEDSEPQRWRKDRIRVAIATALYTIGEDRRAEAVHGGVGPTEVGRLETLRIVLAEDGDLGAEIESLTAHLASEDLGAVMNALEGCVEVFDRAYGEASRRNEIEALVRDTWYRVPRQVKVEVLRDLARVALAHGDTEKALQLIEEQQEVTESFPWAPEQHVPFKAWIAEALFLAGETERAASVTQEALALYEVERGEILDLRRARALLPLAEALVTMESPDRAREVYKRAVIDGSENPNSRVVANDLGAICRSLAERRVEPDEELWLRLLEVCDGLGDPW